MTMSLLVDSRRFTNKLQTVYVVIENEDGKTEIESEFLATGRQPALQYMGPMAAMRFLFSLWGTF